MMQFLIQLLKTMPMKSFYYLSLPILLLLLAACDSGEIKTAPDSPASPEAFVDAHQQWANDIKAQVEEAKKNRTLKRKLKEEVGFDRFDGQEAEISQAEIFYDSLSTLHAEIIYFNVVPLGVKRWYIEKEEPILVEVFMYKQDESGSLIEEFLYRVFISPNDDIYEFRDATTQKIDFDRQNILVPELSKERKMLKDLANKYRPK